MLAKAAKAVPGGAPGEPATSTNRSGTASGACSSSATATRCSRAVGVADAVLPRDRRRGAAASSPAPLVLDGELVVAQGARPGLRGAEPRIHPAASRVTMLAEQTPAWFVAFDLLEDADGVHLDAPFAERRRPARAQPPRAGGAPFFLTPATTDPDVARQWFETFEGAGSTASWPSRWPTPTTRQAHPHQGQAPAHRRLRGRRVPAAHVRPGRRLAAARLSRRRGSPAPRGRLLVVHRMARRAELVDELAPLVTDLDEHPWDPETRRRGRRPASGRGQPLEREEEHDVRPACARSWSSRSPTTSCRATASGTTRGSRRWRPDRDARSCTFDQLERPVSYDVGEVLRRGRPPIGQDGLVSHLIVLTENALTEHDVTRIVEWHEGELRRPRPRPRDVRPVAGRPGRRRRRAGRPRRAAQRPRRSEPTHDRGPAGPPARCTSRSSCWPRRASPRPAG